MRHRITSRSALARTDGEMRSNYIFPSEQSGELLGDRIWMPSPKRRNVRRSTLTGLAKQVSEMTRLTHCGNTLARAIRRRGQEAVVYVIFIVGPSDSLSNLNADSGSFERRGQAVRCKCWRIIRAYREDAVSDRLEIFHDCGSPAGHRSRALRRAPLEFISARNTPVCLPLHAGLVRITEALPGS